MKGFTLIELLVVIAIFLILGTLLFTGIRKKDNDTDFRREDKIDPEKVCVDRGGVPIPGDYGGFGDCKFPPNGN
jgi:prepilin-type N-terminal cleavage/methylation domain-containing protein